MDNMKKNINEVAPPGSSGSVRAMIVKHGDKFDPDSEGKGKKLNPYAIAWSQYKKGANWHYKEKGDKDTTKGKVPPKKKKYKNECITFKEWVQLKENNIKISPTEINALPPLELAKKTINIPKPQGVGPLAYAIMLKLGMAN